MSADPEKRTRWETTIHSALNGLHQKSEFSLLASNQLVGTLLLVFVEKELLSSTRGVEIASRKTGMAGMAGNKGSVAIRLTVDSTTFGIISSHLAAGQFYSFERDKEAHALPTELTFTRAPSIIDHEYAGDALLPV